MDHKMTTGETVENEITVNPTITCAVIVDLINVVMYHLPLSLISTATNNLLYNLANPTPPPNKNELIKEWNIIRASSPFSSYISLTFNNKPIKVSSSPHDHIFYIIYHL